MKQITFRELLNLMYEGKAPERIKYNGDVYQNYKNDDYENKKNVLFISSKIGKFFTVGLMARNKCITICDDILDDKEEEYLSNFIKPFKKYVITIKKIPIEKQEQIIIMYHDYLNTDGFSFILLPTFKQGTMYRGMKLWEEYTLEELGL